MKVLYLHQYFNTPSMSGGTRSYEMARRLVDAGQEVHIITSNRKQSDGARDWYETTESGIRVHWLPEPYSNMMGYGARTKAFARFAWKAARRAANIPANIVFATSTPLSIAVPGVYASRHQRIPMVFEVRDLWPEVPIALGALRSRLGIAAARRLERFAYRNASHVVALSPDMKAGVVATGYPADQVSVIPNACDRDLFHVDNAQGLAIRAAHPWLLDRPLVIYTGTLGMVNGVSYLVQLAAHMQALDPEIRFVVIGEGREEEQVRAKAIESGVFGVNFHMLPPIRKDLVPAWLSAATIATSLVVDVPALWANSANKVFDALAAGRPIAINHCGWLADFIKEEACGLVLDSRDVETATHLLRQRVRDKQWLAMASNNAIRVARFRFDRDKLALQLLEVLQHARASGCRNRARRPDRGNRRVSTM